MSIILRNKNITIMFVMTILLLVGHYYIYATPLNILREIRIISTSALLALCLFGSIFLLFGSVDARSHKIFALQLFLVAFAAGLTLIQIVTQDDTVTTSSLISPGMLIYGNMYAFIMLAYPFEFFCRERMSFNRYAWLFLPLFLMIIIYFGYIPLSGDEMTEVDNWRSLLTNFHKLDIWVRLVILIYPVWLLWFVIRQKKHYIDWYCKNFSHTNDINLRWINYYIFGYSIMLISYLIVMLSNNYQNTVMHSVVFLALFCSGLYYILRQKTYFLLENSDKLNGMDAELICGADKQVFAIKDIVEDKHRFVDKIPQYKYDLEKWMQDNKPYRNNDFKLLDVMQVLPLNRSYISQLFNDGYGETFFNFVMRYRIEESVYLLENHPEMNIRHVSDLCGFSSPSVFGRAFLKNKGVTPKQYRINFNMQEAIEW